jgi:hypothetical protein
MGLADEDMRNVLVRATEIERTTPSRADLDILMQAAEEVGIPRAAVERALRERLALPMKPPSPGDLVFACSADGKYYVAEVLTASDDGCRVRYLRGGEHTVALAELRPCSFLPGERVVCDWPHWGAWTCTVLSYDAEARRVNVTDGWGENREFRISEVWIAPRTSTSLRSARMVTALMSAGAAGAAIGSILTALFLR